MFIHFSSFHLFNLLLCIAGSNALKCAYTRHIHNNNSIHGNNHIPNNDTTVEICSSPDSFCYTSWNYDPYDPFNTSLYRIIGRGCWINTEDNQCDNTECISHPKPSKALNNTKFCCCYGNMCNSRFSISLLDSFINFDAVNNVLGEDLNRNYTNFLLFGFMIFFIITVIIVICFRTIFPSSKIINDGKAIDSLHLLESQTISISSAPLRTTCSQFNIDDLTFIEIIGKGSYGTVWKGQLNDSTVAVKVFLDVNNRFWANECLIYSLPFMNHPCLPHFYGCKDKLTESGYLEYCLAIEYGQHGSLQKYLKDHTVDWTKMCKLISTLVQGLAHLHTEVFKDNKFKPSIAHRDLCSRNIIVKADGSCMICDFQFAVQIVDNNNPFLEHRSLVGTVRYLAPELLDGAINLPQRESLKQVDIYALGLILWEIASRCTDLYQGIDAPEYRLPFEQEAGLTPTFDQIKVLVNRHKARPLFPDIWKDSNPAIRLLKETIEECWDHEPEARLTALCIEERLSELPLLWKRYKMETLPNCCVVTTFQQQLKNIQNNINSNNINCSTKQDACSHKTSVLSDALDFKYPQSNCYINKFENSLHYKYNNHHHLLHHPHHNHHFYQMGLNNSNNNKKQDLNSLIEKNLNVVRGNQPKLTLPLQPHQARNPCIERNLMLETSDEYEVLLEQGLKFQTKTSLQNGSNANDSESSIDQQHHDVGNGDLGYPENRALIRPTLPNPIPYVQNAVGLHNVTSMPIKTKDINKYQNSSCPQNHHVKLNLFERFKQKLSIVQLRKMNDKKNNQNKTQLAEECKQSGDNVPASTIGSLLYSKDIINTNYASSSSNNSSIIHTSNNSASSMNIINNNNNNNSTTSANSNNANNIIFNNNSNNSNNNNTNSLALNSSLISQECDPRFLSEREASFRQLDMKNKVTNVSSVNSQKQHLLSQLVKLNNHIDNIEVYLANSGTNNKFDDIQTSETDDNLVEESQLIQTPIVD